MNEEHRGSLMSTLRTLRDLPDQVRPRVHSYGMLFDALVFTPLTEITLSMEQEHGEMIHRVGADPDVVGARGFIRRRLEEIGFRWFNWPES